MQRYFDTPGPNHVVKQAIVVTAKHAGNPTVVTAVQEKYSWWSGSIRYLAISEDKLVIISEDTLRPQPIVDYVLQIARTVGDDSATEEP
jgi:hypothetical protein